MFGRTCLAVLGEKHQRDPLVLSPCIALALGSNIAVFGSLGASPG